MKIISIYGIKLDIFKKLLIFLLSSPWNKVLDLREVAMFMSSKHSSF